jgi:uncharacterized protein (TIGR03437 family)
MRFVALPAALAASAVLCLAQSAGTVTVANYSGLTSTFPIAPGSIASAYGEFGNVETTSATTLSPMPREIAGIRVRLGGQDAPLYFVSKGQINFVVPAVGPGRQTVEVVSREAVIARGSVFVWDVGPGLAVSDPAPNRLQGIIQNQDFATNNQESRARRGQYIIIYATGCGATNPAAPVDAPPEQVSPTAANVEVLIGNAKANVLFAGASPQFPGICQINAVVPERPFITGQTPLYFTVNHIPSNEVLFWVE